MPSGPCFRSLYEWLELFSRWREQNKVICVEKCLDLFGANAYTSVQALDISEQLFWEEVEECR